MAPASCVSVSDTSCSLREKNPRGATHHEFRYSDKTQGHRYRSVTSSITDHLTGLINAHV